MTGSDTDPRTTDLEDGRADMDPEPGVADDSDVTDTGVDGESTGTSDTDRWSEDLPADDDAVAAPDDPLS